MSVLFASFIRRDGAHAAIAPKEYNKSKQHIFTSALRSKGRVTLGMHGWPHLHSQRHNKIYSDHFDLPILINKVLTGTRIRKLG